MVSFWPFKSSRDAASFERTLSTISGKITRAAARNDNLKQKSRRVRVMWTLYAGFAYILAAVLLTLVTGWRNWTAIEVSIVAGGPVLIYLTRTSLTRYYDYRIANTDAYIKSLSKERDDTIEKLKEATKYNSTQQLLEKYGSPPKSKQTATPAHQKTQGQQKPAQAPSQRTGIAPPPTANIQSLKPQNRPSTPQRPTSASSMQGPPPPQIMPPPELPGEEFAPNAFSSAELTKQYSASSPASYTQVHWYDRILDSLLGEDETQAKNRFALICTECRLVNGQAPPGTRSLEDVGRWRCGGCHAWNGKERTEVDAVSQLVQGWEAERKAKETELIATHDGASDLDPEQDASGMAASEDSEADPASETVETPPPARSTRSRTKKGGNK